ncbi:MAG: succinylglutamate desuccinylase/aspartoacylase family protein, partial [Cyanobacteriota bacterium]|nr:succinylglutamate desuccinylase/aspartoacylase family protein [Cyanobacteriota bacterium]
MALETGEATLRVLVVGGTHGNERNAVHLLRHWRKTPEALNASG